MPPLEPRDALPLLACGDLSSTQSALSSTLKHLSTTLKELVEELPRPFGRQKYVRPLFIPFVIRGVLEVTCTALIARTDPFRILVLREIQSSSTYEAGRRVECAIQWKGDVIFEKAAAWDANMKPDKLTRALLGDHQEHVLWRPAFVIFLDALNNMERVGPWSQELQATTPEGFIPRVRGQAQQVYTAASKGIHHEYLLPPGAYTDQSSLDVMIEAGLKTASGLAVVANFCDHLPFGLTHEDALSSYEALQ